MVVWLFWGLLTIPLILLADSTDGQCKLDFEAWIPHPEARRKLTIHTNLHEDLLITFCVSVIVFKVFVEVIFLFGYLIPLLIIVCLYRKLLKSLWQRADITGHVSEGYERGKRRTTKLVIIVVIMFTACVLPYMVSHQ